MSLVSPTLKDQRIYCGKGYFIDHALRNHAKEGVQASIDDVDVSKYLNIQAVLDNPDSIKETHVDGKRTVVFIKKIGRFFAELTQVEENGKVVLHKSFFNQKKEPYAKLNDIRQEDTSSEGGTSSISHTVETAPAISLESRGDVMLNNEKFLNSDGRLIEPLEEGSDLVPTPNSVSSDSKVTDKSSAEQKNEGENVSEPTHERETLENGDVRITNRNSRGEVETVAVERDGKIVSVDSYQDGALFEHTEYDADGRATMVTRYGKDGEAIGVQHYEGGILVSQEAADAVGRDDVAADETINGAVDMGTMRLVMTDTEFDALLKNGSREDVNAYLGEIEDALRVGEGAPLDGANAVRADYRAAVAQYGEGNIPADVMNELEARIKPFEDLKRVLFDRKYALEDRLRALDAQAEAEQDAQAKAEKAAQKQTAFGGFLAGKTALAASTAEKALNKKYKFDGEVMSVAEFVERHANEGTLALSTSEVNKYKGASRSAWNRMSAAEQKADEERVKNSGTKTVYMVNGYDLGKTAYEYVQYLQGQSTENRVQSTAERVAQAEGETNVAPTDGQKKAGNYKKGHVRVAGYDISIEQPKGSVRSGVDANGNEWEQVMQNTYGYIRGTEGVDGDHIDVFLANDMDAWNGEQVFVVDQYNEDGSFDEHKVMLGFNSIEDAQSAYLSNYEDGWADKHRIVVTGTNAADFKKWVDSSHRKTKAFADYKNVKKNEGQSGAENSGRDDVAANGTKNGTADYNIADEALMAERGSEAFARATEHTIDALKAAGVEVVEATDAMVEAVLGLAEMHKQKKAPETESVLEEEHQPSVVSSADGAKVRKDAEIVVSSDVKTEFHRVFHGSGAKFDKFDHSFMGSGEGNQAFGWGTYVTEVEEIGRSYAESTSDNIFKTGFGDFYLKKIHEGMADSKSFEDVKQNLLDYHAHVYEQTGGDKDMFGGFISDYETLRSLKEEDLPKRNLYTVEIPEDNGLNYLNWYNGITDEQKAMIADAAQKDDVEFDFYGDKMNAKEYFANMGKGIEGHQFYGMLKRVLGSDKAASEFLNRIGFVGIKYPTSTLSGGNKDGKSNYVIFNEANAQITDRVEFLRTADGVVYGWAVGGKVYLTKEGMNPNTPAHEYTHLWAQMVEQNDPTLWGRIVDGLRGCATWNDVLNDKAYEGIWGDDSRMASEVLSRLTGAENYRREMARAQAEIDGAKGVFDKAEKVSVWENVKQALRLFLDKVKSLILKGERRKEKGERSLAEREVAEIPSWMQFVNMALGDLYAGVNPTEVLNRRGYDAMSVEIIADEFDLHPTSFTEIISSREELDKYKSVLSEDIYEGAVEDYEKGAAGVAFPKSGVVFVFKENCYDELEEQITWWHEQTHIASLNIPIPDKKGTADKTLDWLMRNAPELYDKIQSHYEQHEWREEGIAMFIGELISRYGTSKFLESDFAELKELATLADIIRNTIKHGTEDTTKKIKGDYRFGQPSSKPIPEFNLKPGRENKNPQGGRSNRGKQEKPGSIRGNASQGAGVEEVDTLYRIREEEAPKNTGIGYKVFVLKNGNLYPPMVANPNGEATPVGVWLDADAAPIAGQSKTGRSQVKAGGKGTQGGSGKLAYRPGWHLGEIPYALQFNRNDENGERTLFPANFVWAEVEYANDVDYQEEAMSYGYNQNGKFQHSYAGLPRVPENGAYKYRTNPNPDTDPWIITGAMRVKRLLTPTEVDEMVKAAGREPQRRQEGAITDEQITALNAEIVNDYRDGVGAYTDDEVSFENDPISKVLGKPRFTRKQRREFAERVRRQMVESVQRMAQQLGLDNVEVVTDVSTLEGKKQRYEHLMLFCIKFYSTMLDNKKLQTILSMYNSHLQIDAIFFYNCPSLSDIMEP